MDRKQFLLLKIKAKLKARPIIEKHRQAMQPAQPQQEVPNGNQSADQTLQQADNAQGGPPVPA